MANEFLPASYKAISERTSCELYDTYRSQYVDVWWDWYRGFVNGFHKYNETVLGQEKCFERLSLGAAQGTAESWAELLTREWYDIEIDDEDAKAYVDEVLKRENFKEEFPKLVELGFGTGTAWMVEYILEEDDDSKLYIDYIDVDYGHPISFRNGIITELATINHFKQGKDWVTHIQFHKSVDDNYVIENMVYVSEDPTVLGNQMSISYMIEYMQLEETIVIPDAKPWFQTIRPNVANTINPHCPFGMAIFAKKLSTVRTIDKKYTEFDSEFELGRKRVMVSADGLKKDLDETTNQYVSYLSKGDKVYQGVSGAPEDMPIKEIDFNLRTQEFIDALNQEFAFLADGVGMDAGSFLFNGVSMKTATEVISEKSKTFGYKKKHDKMIMDVLKGLIRSILEARDFIEGTDSSGIEVKITIPDNIIIDDEKKAETERAETMAGLMPKKQYLMRNKGLTEEEADQWLKDLAAQNATIGIEGAALF